MQSKAATPDEYFETLPEDRKQAMKELRKAILKNLPNGFSEVMSMECPDTLYRTAGILMVIITTPTSRFL